ncbi:MAG: hybrid sensor histidine kinase/response regulator [Azospirillum brasilense]|nr:MAG: hybrid sensor histidine kinase/response regulator [Azospirillum brasilense]
MLREVTDPVYFLLVDDLEENLLSLEALLRRDGLILLKARSGPEALELLLKHEVALALLDVQMPGMDGFELAELMRSTTRTQRVPIIFLTASGDNRQRRFQSYEAGAVDFLSKPIEPDILRSKADVFFSLYRQQLLLYRQRDQLAQRSEENARLLEEARRSAEALKVADRRKDEFLANMSHEIRTPMNAVIGLANILMKSEPLTDRQREFISTLRSSANSLLDLINDLLDISKIESSNLELERTPFSMVKLSEEVISMLNVRAQEKKLNLSLQLECACIHTRHFLGDPARLRQVLVNLCSNAIKFTQEGGVTLLVQCAPAADASSETITLRVMDTGIGIAPEKLDSVFDKFVQADSSINRRYGGTGLGLAISKTLVEAMGGSIQVSSEIGKGSIFEVTLTLPVVAPATATAEDAAQKPAAPASANLPRLLLVEDHPPNVLVARTYLEDFGYAVDHAASGQQAIDMAAQGARYIAILMDVQMPGMSGFEATAKIREAEKARGAPPTPIIGMTAHALLGDRERCLNAGMDDYVPKPFNPDELQQKLDALVREPNMA